MACGNNHVTRDYLSSQPTTSSPLKEIHLRLPAKPTGDADLWRTDGGSFRDPEDSKRERPGVTLPHERNSKSEHWKFAPDPGKGDKAYDHFKTGQGRGRVGWLGPDSVTNRLPADVARQLQGRRSIVLGRQNSVVRPAK